MVSLVYLQAPKRPSSVLTSNIAYVIKYYETAEEEYYSTASYYNSSHSEGDQLSYTLLHLSRDTDYTVEVAMRVSYSVCSYSYVYGNYSDPVSFQTNATRKRFYADKLMSTIYHT